jgi:regulator of extracellular matrix RemA (YlzA/DUF370 family)
MELVGIGFGNLLAADRIISVINPDSAPIKRVVTEARAQGLLVDATQGRKTGSVIVCDSGHVVLSYLSPEKLVSGMESGR